MQARPEDLPRLLDKGLESAYLICGDEQLLVLEAADLVRRHARDAGFAERNVFEVDKTFDWTALTSAARAMSLFAEQRVLDVRIPSGKPGREGGAALREVAEDAGGANLLLVTTPKLDKASLGTAWARALDQAGLIIQCWPIRPQELPRWLEQRMRSRELEPDREAVLALAERTEGNLLAAAQEIDKLRLLKGAGPVTGNDVVELVADSARFQLFAMLDAALSGRADRAVRMARGLRAEGNAVAVIAVVLTREVRLLAQLRSLLDRGGNLQQVYREARIWDKKRVLLERAMRRAGGGRWQRLLIRCAALDRAVKGLDPRDPWTLAEDILVAVAVGP